jgi:hypothetical protein
LDKGHSGEDLAVWSPSVCDKTGSEWAKVISYHIVQFFFTSNLSSIACNIVQWWMRINPSEIASYRKGLI